MGPCTEPAMAAGPSDSDSNTQRHQQPTLTAQALERPGTHAPTLLEDGCGCQRVSGGNHGGNQGTMHPAEALALEAQHKQDHCGAGRGGSG